MVMASECDAVDVTITNTHTPRPGESIRARLTKAFRTKQRTYAAFKTITGYRIVPFVMSVYGLVAKETRDLLQDWRKHASEPSFLADLYNNSRMALVKAQYTTFEFIQNKHKLQKEKKHWMEMSQKQPQTSEDLTCE